MKKICSSFVCFLTFFPCASSGDNEDNIGKIVEILTLGRPAMLGEQYSAHSDLFIPGFSLWSPEEIEKEKRIVWNPSSHTDFSADTSRDDKTNNLKVTASLKASFEAGMIKVSGSASYLDSSEDKKDTSTVTLSFHSISRTETLSTNLLDETITKNCKLPIPGNSGLPTHIVAGVTYGGNCHIVFEKTLNDKEDKKKITGALKVKIKGATWSINAQASLDLSSGDTDLSENLSIKLFSDFLLKEQPLTFNDTLKIYQDISSNFGSKDSLYNQSVPMSVVLIPLQAYCTDGGLAAQIGKDILKRATNIRLTLLKVLDEIIKLLNSRSAEGNFEVRELLLGFQSDVSHYTLDYETKLQKIIIGARNPGNAEINETSLFNLVEEYINSPYNYDTLLFTYLTERTRQVNAINIFYTQTLLQNEPQIAVYTKADVPQALITKRLLFLLTLYVLPNVSACAYNYTEWTNNDKKSRWYNNLKIVGEIGNMWRDFRTFFQQNGYEEGLNFFVLLEPEKCEQKEEEMPMKLQLYIDGSETKEPFKLRMLQKLSTNPQVCRKSEGTEITIRFDTPKEYAHPNKINDVFVSITSKPSILKTILKTKNCNYTTLTIPNLVPEFTYKVSVAYSTKYGSLTQSKVITKVGQFDQMRKIVGCEIENDIMKIDITKQNENLILNITASQCAAKCHSNQSCSNGWNFQLATGNCYFIKKGTNSTQITGWAVGSQSCNTVEMVDEDCGKMSTSTILQNEELILKKGYLITTVPFLWKEFKLSFDVFISNFTPGVQNIVHFTSTGNDCCNYGDRLPAVYIYGDQRTFYIRFALNGNGNGGYAGTVATTGEWIHLEISQTLIDNKYIFEIKIKQNLVFHVENKQAEVFANVKAFAAGDQYGPLDGMIRKLELDTKC